MSLYFLFLFLFLIYFVILFSVNRKRYLFRGYNSDIEVFVKEASFMIVHRVTPCEFAVI